MNKQKGFVLAIAMILLGILTLLAVSALSTSASVLVMAGNEQYRARAFAAAERGIETAIAAGGFNPSVPVTTVSAAFEDGDGYTASLRPRGSTPTAEHYEIESTGTSLRNASATVVQGFYRLVPEGTLVRSYWRIKGAE